MHRQMAWLIQWAMLQDNANVLILETAKNEPHRTLAQTSGLKIENGWIELPRTPGLGIELDEEVIRAHPYRPRAF